MSIIPAVTGVSVPERFAIPEPQKNVHVYLVYRVLMCQNKDDKRTFFNSKEEIRILFKRLEQTKKLPKLIS